MTETEEDVESTEDNKTQTEINASLSALDVTVKTEGKEECEELFYNVWDSVVEDAGEMSEAMRDRLSGQ